MGDFRDISPQEFTHTKIDELQQCNFHFLRKQCGLFYNPYKSITLEELIVYFHDWLSGRPSA